MVDVKIKCGSCGDIVNASIAQNIQVKGVYWSMSYACAHCGEVLELDDSSPTPQELRTAILESNGGSVLELNAEKQNRIKAAKSLASLFYLPTPTALKRVAEIIENGGMIGTEKEIEWLAENFGRDEIYFQIRHISDVKTSLPSYRTLYEGELLTITQSR